MASGMVERDLGWKRIKRELSLLDGSYTKVGLMADATREDAKGTFQQVAAIGAIHEFGAPGAGIPRRPFLSAALEEYLPQIRDLKAKLLNSIYEGVRGARAALGILGQSHEDQVKAKIVAGPWEPLKPATIARKGSSVPLIDSGQMRGSVRHVEVVDGAE